MEGGRARKTRKKKGMVTEDGVGAGGGVGVGVREATTTLLHLEVFPVLYCAAALEVGRSPPPPPTSSPPPLESRLRDSNVGWTGWVGGRCQLERRPRRPQGTSASNSRAAEEPSPHHGGSPPPSPPSRGWGDWPATMTSRPVVVARVAPRWKVSGGEAGAAATTPEAPKVISEGCARMRPGSQGVDGRHSLQPPTRRPGPLPAPLERSCRGSLR